MAKNDKTSEPALRHVVVRRPGVLACGEYKAGVIYAVDHNTAERLITAKGFTEVSRAEYDAQQNPTAAQAAPEIREE